MQPAGVKAFKNELGNYRYYQSEIKSYEAEIEECYYLLGGVRGVDPFKEPIHSPPNKDLEWRTRERITAYEKKISLVRAKKEGIEQILNQIEMPLRKAVIDIYADKKTFRSIAPRHYLSETGLKKRINKAIANAIKNNG